MKTLNWNAMTMSFKVADKTLFSKLVEGKKVEAEFTQMDKDYSDIAAMDVGLENARAA